MKVKKDCFLKMVSMQKLGITSGNNEKKPQNM